MLSNFANPWGLLALFGLPVVLAIHLLRHRTRFIPVSTLFLLDITAHQSHGGRSFRRLLPSIPLFLQLLIVILIALVLSEPRWPWNASVLRVAIVLDDSASMRAFTRESVDALFTVDRMAKRRARDVEWLILPDRPTEPHLYAGTSLQDAQKVLENHAPVGGSLDPSSALRLARERVGADGWVVYLTDTPKDRLPADASLLAIGRPLDNVGVAGVTFSQSEARPRWEALLVNHSKQPQQRTWQLYVDGKPSGPPTAVTFQPGQLQTIQGRVPEGADRLRINLSPDVFALDDSYPFLLPQPKPLFLRSTLPPALDWLTTRLQRTVPAVFLADSATNNPQNPSAAPDLTLTTSEEMAAALAHHAVLLCSAGEENAKFLEAPVVAARHPFNNGLVWDALTVQDVPMLPARVDDTVLVWSGENVPLVSLREVPLSPAKEDTAASSSAPRSARQLVFHFNPAFSNVERLPAPAVLLLRFLESVRKEKIGKERIQCDPNQSLGEFLPSSPRPMQFESLDDTGKLLSERTIAPHAVRDQRALNSPGFFRLRSDETLWLEASVAFADGREADFSACATQDNLAQASLNLSKNANNEAHWWQPVLLLMMALSVLAWYLISRTETQNARSPAYRERTDP